MRYIISNSSLKVEVLGKGAEISSIKSLVTGKEYMWDAKPSIWGSHAPVLFPIIGALKNGECTINNHRYNIPKHGIVRNNEALALKHSSNETLRFQLDWSEQTLGIYPYKFRFTITFKLNDNSLVISHQVKNLDETELFFSLGAHPGFRCPINEGEAYEDYYLEFEKVENAATTMLTAEGLISEQTEQILTESKILPLTTELFKKDALIFKDLHSRKVSLKSHKSKQVLTVSYHDFPYLGLWAKPNAPFVCIEPWLGIADHEKTDGNFLNKDGLICLPKNQTYKAQYSIKVDE